MVDLHSHILYGIKDSPTDIGLSVEIARQYAQRGFSHVVSTPHFNPEKDSIDAFVSLCAEKYAELKSRLVAESIDLHVIPGAEVVMSPEIVELENIAKLCIANTPYLLVELPWDDFPRCTRSVLFWLGLQKITPILAHPERNREIWMLTNRYRELIDTEVLLQIDIPSFIGSKQSRKAIEHFFYNGAVTFVATDIHHPDDFSTIDKAIAAAEKRYGCDEMERIWNNSSGIIESSQPI